MLERLFFRKFLSARKLSTRNDAISQEKFFEPRFELNAPPRILQEMCKYIKISLTSNQIYSFGNAFARALAIECKETNGPKRRNNGLVVRATNVHISKQRRLGKDSLRKKRNENTKGKKGKLREIESVPNCGTFHTKRLLALIVKEVVRQGNASLLPTTFRLVWQNRFHFLPYVS